MYPISILQQGKVHENANYNVILDKIVLSFSYANILNLVDSIIRIQDNLEQIISIE